LANPRVWAEQGGREPLGDYRGGAGETEHEVTKHGRRRRT
jgi:hypothetical protein